MIVLDTLSTLLNVGLLLFQIHAASPWPNLKRRGRGVANVSPATYPETHNCAKLMQMQYHKHALWMFWRSGATHRFLTEPLLPSAVYFPSFGFVVIPLGIR